MNKEDTLFLKGIEAFNNRQFYKAHEIWEELWLDYKLDDAQFIQGLIQLSVSYFHLFNHNLKGARSMIKKCLVKFDPFNIKRGIDVIELRSQIHTVQDYINKIDNVSINKSDKDYNEYLNLSKVKIADSMYNTYDYWLKKKYKVDINYQALEEVKNLIK